ncbi:unnamed protein product, partial [Laminaria digitata]
MRCLRCPSRPRRGSPSSFPDATSRIPRRSRATPCPRKSPKSDCPAYTCGRSRTDLYRRRSRSASRGCTVAPRCSFTAAPTAFLRARTLCPTSYGSWKSSGDD